MPSALTSKSPTCKPDFSAAPPGIILPTTAGIVGCHALSPSSLNNRSGSWLNSKGITKVCINTCPSAVLTATSTPSSASIIEAIRVSIASRQVMVLIPLTLTISSPSIKPAFPASVSGETSPIIGRIPVSPIIKTAA